MVLLLFIIVNEKVTKEISIKKFRKAVLMIEKDDLGETYNDYLEFIKYGYFRKYYSNRNQVSY